MKKPAQASITLKGVSIAKDETNHWIVSTASCSYELINTNDFMRAIFLLEEPLKKTELILGPDFPYSKVIEAAFQGKSNHWTELALAWISDSPDETYQKFAEQLSIISKDHIFSQRTRHAALRLIKQHTQQC
jgi:hypothetical protein